MVALVFKPSSWATRCTSSQTSEHWRYVLNNDDFLKALRNSVIVSISTVVIALVIGSFAAYNFLFTHPRFTFEVSDSGQLLNLVLLLIVGVVVGQLAAIKGPR